jgi:parallel beta-helix repeat protein
MLFVVVLAVAVTPAAATDVTYSGQKIVISSPGTYVLKNDITNSDLMICIEIQASNVVFDGGGHLIDGKDSLNSAGIYVHGPSSTLTGVTVKNVRMQDWWYGVYFHKIASSKLQDSTLSSNGFTGAVVYESATSNSITGCSVTGNDYGLVFSASANNCVVSDNTISGNVRGIFTYLSDGLTATRNRVENNINTGIQFQVSGGGTIYNNRLNNNLNVAFTGDSFKANAWSVTPGANWSPANIIGGPKVGGNYWSRPDGTGFSQTNPDADGDGFVDIALQIAEQNFDYYPLAVYTGPVPSTPTPTPTPIVTVTPTPTAGAQTPYRSVTLPARLEAENYDLGGEGVAYHDNDAANLGGAYRTSEGVDVESAGGTTNIGYIRANEWTEYTVNVPATGTYPATFRVAGWATGRTVQVQVDGNLKATVNVPNSGSYSAWRTVTVQLPLEAGTRTLKFLFNTDKQNLDYVEFGTPTGVTVTPTPTPTPVVTSTVTPDPGQAAYNGPHALPGTVQAEDFDTGGQNVAYYDSTVENKAANTPGVTAYRPSEYVDAETGNGISNIGWIVDGEWTEYTVTVAAAGSYTANFRVGSWNNDRHAVVLTVDGGTGCTVIVPNTGSSSAFQEVTAPLTLTAGTHVIRLKYEGSGQNIDWFAVGGGPTPTVTPTPEVTPTANVTVTPTPEVTVTATPTPTPEPGGQAPYKTFNAPCRVEAEDYDTGGEGVAYHDTTAENQGLAYRLAEGVDVDAGGSTHVGYINTGEWIEYTVNVPAAGTYPTAFRVGSWYTNLGTRSIAVSVDDASKGTVIVPITGTDIAYQTVTVPLALDAGAQTIRLTFNGPRQNLDWFEIGTGTVPTATPTPTATTTVTVQPGGQAPYNGPHAMPGRVEAEDFDYGGQNVAYWDSTIENKAANTPGVTAYRPTEYVDAEIGNGISNIGWITAGEWTEYTVDVAAAGSYTATFRVGAWGDGRQVTLTVDGAPGCTIAVPNTGSSSAFQEVTAPLSLTAGTHVIRLSFNNNYQNIDWFQTAPVA